MKIPSTSSIHAYLFSCSHCLQLVAVYSILLLAFIPSAFLFVTGRWLVKESTKIWGSIENAAYRRLPTWMQQDIRDEIGVLQLPCAVTLPVLSKRNCSGEKKEGGPVSSFGKHGMICWAVFLNIIKYFWPKNGVRKPTSCPCVCIGAGSAGNSERAERLCVPNHGVACGAGSTTSLLGPRGKNRKTAPFTPPTSNCRVRGHTSSTSPPSDQRVWSCALLFAADRETWCNLINPSPCLLICKVTGSSFVCVCTCMHADQPGLVQVL